MLRLRTKTQFFLQKDRLLTNATVRLIVDSLFFDINNCVVIGYYYYFDEENNVVKLDDFRFTNTWNIISQVENNILQPVTSQNIKDIILQRLFEFTMLQLQVEANQNYNTIDTDWELDN